MVRITLILTRRMKMTDNDKQFTTTPMKTDEELGSWFKLTKSQDLDAEDNYSLDSFAELILTYDDEVIARLV